MGTMRRNRGERRTIVDPGLNKGLHDLERTRSVVGITRHIAGRCRDVDTNWDMLELA